MDGMTLNKRRVIFRSNMFDPTQREIVEVDKSLSFLEIYKSLTFYPESYSVIIDGDVKVKLEDYGKIPESDNVYIKLYPAGFWSDIGKSSWEATKDVTNTVMDSKEMDLITSKNSFIATAVLAPWFLPTQALLWGIHKGFNAYVNFMAEDPPPAGIQSNTLPSLRGGANRARQGSRLPILLGRHLIHPDIAALSYIEVTEPTGQNQWLHMAFCAGYGNLVIDMATYKIGDKLISTYPSGDCLLEMSQYSTAELAYYPKRVIAQSVSAEITHFDDDGVTVSEGVTMTTPTNTKDVEVLITFPSGLYCQTDGKKTVAGVTYRIQYRASGTSTWSEVGSYTQTQAINYTLRYTVKKEFSNLTTVSADYCANRQYDIKVTRTTVDKDPSVITDKMIWDSMQSYTGVFNGVSVDTSPIASPYELTRFGLKMKATSVVQGEIESFNFIAQSRVCIYSGSGTGAAQWTTVTASSNPAALFLHVLRDANINKPDSIPTDDQINWASFEAWYNYCALSTNLFECNAYVMSEIIIEELLNQICTCGRASWSIIDGKFNIIIDKAQTVICQYFTPRNSWGFSASKNFDKLTNGLRLKFVDAASGYIEGTRYVYADPADESDPNAKIDDCQLWGCTSADEAYKHGRYNLANIHLRREAFSFNADIEQIQCTRWDRIALSHDVCSVGLGYARIKTLRVTGSTIVGFEIDERVIFEPAKTYVATIRLQNGTGITYAIDNPASTVNIDTDELFLHVPIDSGDEPFNVDDLLVFGETDTEILDLIVVDIDQSDDFSAKLSCIPYVSELYTWESGTIPEYDSKVSLPGDLDSALFIGIPINPADMAIANSQAIGDTNNILTALTTIYNTLVELSNGTFQPSFPRYNYTTGELMYYNVTDGGIWSKSVSGVTKGAELVSANGYLSCQDLYVKSDDGCIYTTAGVQLTYSESWSPIRTEAGDVVYAKLSDGGMYIKRNVSGLITRVGAFTLKNYEMYYYGNNKVLIWDDGTIDESGDDGFILIDLLTGAYNLTLKSNVGEVVQFNMMDYDTLLYTDAAFNLYRIELLTDETLLYIPNVFQFDAFSDAIYYVSADDFKTYLQYKDLFAARIDSRPYLQTVLTAISITGSGIIDTNIIYGISAADMGVIYIDDILSGTGIPDGTKVLTIDSANSRILINKKITETFSAATIDLITARVQIDAESGIAPGTVVGANIATGAIDYGHLFTDSVRTAAIKNSNVTGDKIANEAVDFYKLTKSFKLPVLNGDGVSILTDKIVLASHLSDGFLLPGSKLSSAAITTTHLANNFKLPGSNIASAAITTTLLSSLLRIPGLNIGDNAVGTGHIATGYTLIKNDGNKEIKQRNLDFDATGVDKIVVPAANVGVLTVGNLGTDAVETIKIRDYNVTTSKLAQNAVTQYNMADDSVGTAEIINGNVTLAKISSDFVLPTGKIASTLSSKTIDSSCSVAPKARYGGMLFPYGGTITKNQIFDALSPHIPTTGDTMMMSGGLFDSSAGHSHIICGAGRASATQIDIYAMIYSTGQTWNYPVTDGDATAMPNAMMCY